MKTILKKLLILWVSFSFFLLPLSNYAIDLSGVPGGSEIQGKSITITSSWDLVDDVNGLWIKILTFVKIVFEWVLIIYIVYAWVKMIISMWNEEDLSSSKKSIRYSLVWLVFINMPWTLYEAFKQDSYWTLGWSIGDSWTTIPWGEYNNILVNFFNFWTTLNSKIVWFIEVAISAIAMIFIIIAWINIIRSRWKEEEFQKAKSKITWSIIWLIFIWFIEAWRNFIFTWDISDWKDVFETMSNLALFFAWPVAIFFLTMAAYYYINSNGEEERIKKAKNIVINTVIATVLLLASYTFLLDLATL